jgi:hypothetical protein
MESDRFDCVTRAISLVLSRRGFAGALGLAVAGLSGLAEAKKKKRKKKKKIKRNDFGCVNVGGFCKNSGQCCSGICKGKNGKKKCHAHDASTCQAGQQPISCNGGADIACATSTGGAGLCGTTTGNAGYCTNDIDCFACTKDLDCQPFCGPQAACVACNACPGGVGCAGVDGCDVP